MTNVYFATNRAADAAAKFGYGAQIVPNDINKITFGVADVTVNHNDADSGDIKAIGNKTAANFPPPPNRRSLVPARICWSLSMVLTILSKTPSSARLSIASGSRIPE